MRLGVYIPTFRSPAQLRMAVLQLMVQTRKPDVLVIFEDANQQSYEWVIQDLKKQLSSAGIELGYGHCPSKLIIPEFFRVPLDELIMRGCDRFVKIDDDDIIYRCHLETLEKQMRGAFARGAQFVVGRRADLLVMLNSGGFKYKTGLDFGVWNPTGGQPNSTIFTRDVAKAWTKLMLENIGTPEDVLFAKYIMRDFPGESVDIPSTTCYVSHGKNGSTAAWSNDPPSEVL